jgi:triosephosphate isomerase
MGGFSEHLARYGRNDVISERRPLMAGNWKMNLSHHEAVGRLEKLVSLLTPEDFAATEVAVLPPFTALNAVQAFIDGHESKIWYGAQDLSPHDHGAHTGDISGSMLAALGCTYVLVGHSERRHDHGEGDGVVHAKTQAAWRHGVVPILCVGEGLEVRQREAHVDFTVAQLEAALAGASIESAESLVVAYEPVWAIGTGEVATPEDAQEVCSALRFRLRDIFSADVADSMRVIYGGSVKPSNISDIMAQPDVDGALVGGASLDTDEFVAICRYREGLTS